MSIWNFLNKLFQSKFENEKTSLAEALAKAQICLQQEKTRSQELSSQCRTYKNSSDSIQQEFEDYKLKSQRILQSKEKLFLALKASQGGERGDNDGAKNCKKF